MQKDRRRKTANHRLDTRPKSPYSAAQEEPDTATVKRRRGERDREVAWSGAMVRCLEGGRRMSA